MSPAVQSASMSPDERGAHPPAPRRGRNLRTALVLLSIALVFFIGVIVNRLVNG